MVDLVFYQPICADGRNALRGFQFWKDGIVNIFTGLADRLPLYGSGYGHDGHHIGIQL